MHWLTMLHHLASFVSMLRTVVGVQAVGQQDAWKAALHRARGEKVLDDPKLLKR